MPSGCRPLSSRDATSASTISVIKGSSNWFMRLRSIHCRWESSVLACEKSSKFPEISSELQIKNLASNLLGRPGGVMALKKNSKPAGLGKNPVAENDFHWLNSKLVSPDVLSFPLRMAPILISSGKLEFFNSLFINSDVSIISASITSYSPLNIEYEEYRQNGFKI